jgi:hypothetical protein
MPFRRKSKQVRHLRYFVYLSDVKLQMLLDQIEEAVKRSIAAELKIDFKLVSLKLTSPALDRSLHESSRIAKLEIVESYLRSHHEMGDLTCTAGYFEANMMMDWKPCDDNETVLFCGYQKTRLVVLGGSISNLFGRPSSATQIGSHPYTIRAAVRHGGKSNNLGFDLNAAAQEIYSTPQPVRFLAHVIFPGRLPEGSEQSDYILATPLYVEVTETVSL